MQAMLFAENSVKRDTKFSVWAFDYARNALLLLIPLRSAYWRSTHC
jgi:hypothetical protein